jgi:Leucine-rich repeat (LRR) protein
LTGLLNCSTINLSSSGIVGISGDVSTLTSLNALYLDDNPSLTAFGAYQSASIEILSIANCGLTAVPDVEGLTSLADLRLADNSSLATWNGTVLLDELGEIDLSNGALTEETIDRLVAALVAAGRTSESGSCILDISGGTSAEPSEDALLDIATLESRGWTVTTN